MHDDDDDYDDYDDNPMMMMMMMMVFRSDEQRSEKHKLKKERELERDIAQQEREDDGGFSMKVGMH